MLGVIALASSLVTGASLAQTTTPPTAAADDATNASLGATYGVAPSQGLNGAVRVGAVYSDNIARNDADKQSDVAGEAGVRFTEYEQRPHLKANVTGDVEFQEHSDRAYGNEALGGVAGSVQFGIVPDRFGWTVQENFGQTRTNALAAETPANRQNVNFVSTGPDLILPLGGVTSLNLDARWSKATFETSVADDQQVGGSLGIARKLSASSSASVNVSDQHVRYDNGGPNSDFDIRSAFLQYSSTGRRTTVRAQLGATQLHDFAGNSNEPLVGIVVSHYLTPRTSITLDVGSSYSDSAQQFRSSQTIGGISHGSGDVLVGTDPLRAEHAAAGWNLEGLRTSLQLRAVWQRERHETQTTLNRDGSAATANLQRRVTPTLTIGLAGYYGRQEFIELGSTLDDWSAEATMSWQISTEVSLVVRGGRFAGNGSVSINSPFAYIYTENRASITLSYGRTR